MPLVIVTSGPAFVHTPLVLITADVIPLVVVATVNDELYAAVAGTPVSVTAGDAFRASVD